jgi:outer membrane protein assembly factor BamB
MDITHTDQPPPQTILQTNKPRRPLRLWPGVVFGVLLLLLRFVVPIVLPEATIFGMPATVVGILGGMFCGFAIFVWWVFFSRAPWAERLGIALLMIVALVATYRIIHVSIATGSMGYLFPVLAIPILGLAFVAAVVATNHLAKGLRRAAIVATILLACGGWTLVRTGGFDGNFNHDFAWRWSKTPEERLLAQQGDEPMAVASVPVVLVKTGADWPGFRGPDRDGVVHGARIATNWSDSPPLELWRRPIGPAWSSFAVRGDLLYTQEQRGNDEIVACYSVTSGKPVWKHRDSVRFWESNAGAGPRGTPTLSDGRVYSLGATGVLNALDAGNGAVVWSRNAASDTGAKLPGWGFSSSPLVLDNLVIVATAGKLVAYDVATGEPRWYGPDGGSGYSSPQLVNIKGVQQILLLSGTGATSVSPTDGKKLWEYPLSPSARIVQPGLTADGDVLTHDGEGNAMRRIAVANGPSGWTVAERWESFGLNPYFNDFVVHDGHAYGFAGSNLACVDLKDGERKWKGGHFGNGQLVLLPDQNLLLVLSEEGELALVAATPNQFTELARVPAIKGKTWNHPVLVGDVVLVRNSEEMAAFRLSLESR